MKERAMMSNFFINKNLQKTFSCCLKNDMFRSSNHSMIQKWRIKFSGALYDK